MERDLTAGGEARDGLEVDDGDDAEDWREYEEVYDAWRGEERLSDVPVGHYPRQHILFLNFFSVGDLPTAARPRVPSARTPWSARMATRTAGFILAWA